MQKAPRLFGFVTLIASLAGTGPLLAQVPGGFGPETQARIDAVFEAMDSTHKPGCALSVMEEGRPVYLKGYGMANLEYDVPIAPSSVFHVASVSKQFTAFAVSLLAAEGKVSWEDDIREYVPEVPDFGETITLRHLVNHTSGIRDQWSLLSMAGWRFEADVITQDDVLEITSRQQALNFPVGDQYLYSNTGFTLLAVVVERVSGQTLKEFTQERMFGPLGMTGTHFHDDHNTIVPDRAYAYAPLGREEGYRISIPDFDVVGATSLHTTVEDMARWDRNFYTAGVGGQDVLEGMHERGILRSGDTIGYALGLSHGRYRGLPTVGHGGADAGYRSDFLRFPEQEVSVAVLCNFPSSNPGNLSRRVADVVMEEAFPEPLPDPEAPGEEARADEATDEAADEEPAPDPVPLSETELEELAGYYTQEANDRPMMFRERGGHLFLEGRVRLFHEGDGVLRPDGDDETVRLVQDSDGSVSFIDPEGDRWLRRPPVDRGSLEPDPYVGRYWSEELGAEYEVGLEEGRLFFYNRKIGRRNLNPVFQDGFGAGGNWVTFFRDPAGDIAGFTLSSGRVWKVRFERVE
jgi:CubicO group peptidase (beta-lactamase class C family)